MLELTAPLWLAGLVLIPIVRWLHRFHDEPHMQLVPALFLWRDAPKLTSAGRRKGRPDPIWRLRALILLCTLVALAGPRWQTHQPPPLEIWVDDSLSMFADDGAGPRIRVGLQQALAAAFEANHARVGLRSLGNPGASLPLTEFGSHAWPTVLDDWIQAPRGPAMLPLPVTMQRDAEHWLVTDGTDPNLASWLEQAPIGRVFQIGQFTENVAITRMAARPSPQLPDQIEVLITVANAGSRSTERTITLRADDQPLHDWPLNLGVGQSASHQFDLPLGKARALQATIEPRDALALDDEATLDLGVLAPVRVAVDGPCGQHLAAALAAHPRLKVVDGTTGAGLAVRCGALTAEPPLPTIVATIPERNRVIDAPVTASPGTAAERWPHLDRTWVNASDKPLAGTPLLRSGPLVLVSTHTLNRQRIVEVGFDLAAPEFVKRPEFPALVDALVGEALNHRLLDDTPSLGRPLAESQIAPHPVPQRRAQSMATHSAAPLTPFFAAICVLLLGIDFLRSGRRNGRSVDHAALA